MSFDIEEYCLENLERAKKGRTGQISAVCPWCQKYGAFYVNAKTGDYICFKCEEKGKLGVGIISKVEGITWYEAKNYLLKNLIENRRKYTVPTIAKRIFALRNLKQENEEQDKIFELPKEYIPIYKNGIWKYPKYLKDRKIKKETARKWNLGFCNQGRYKNRIIIPIVCENGSSFTSRSIYPEIKPKYLNPVCDFQKTLLGGWNLFDKNSDFILVEGPFDAIKMNQHGFNVLFLGGKTIHQQQKIVLSKLSNELSVTIMLDPEEEKAPVEIAKELFFMFTRIFIARLEIGIDPGSSTKKQAFDAYDFSTKYTGRKKDIVFSLRKKICNI